MQQPRCDVGNATLHTAWASVFYHFPERIDFDVDGYIATADCSDIGEERQLYFGGRWWRVKISDCLNRNDTPSDGWLVDVDYRIWYATRTPITPTPAILRENADVYLDR